MTGRRRWERLISRALKFFWSRTRSSTTANFVEALKPDGHRIQRTTSIEGGITFAGEGNHDLIVCSLNLRGGGDVLRMVSQLRASDKTRQTPILMIGDGMQIDQLAKAMDLGVNDYVVKPFDRNELIARVRTQIRRRRFQDLLRRNYESSLSLALIDSLTGLYNRRYLLTYLQGLMNCDESQRRPLAVLLIDVDHFKPVNDTHGHAAGDAVLRDLAAIMTGNVRNVDMVARIGGEEFVVVMPDTNPAIADVVARRLLNRVEQHGFGIGGGTVLNVTISIGVTISHSGLDSIEGVLAEADAALYAAKHQGRNRVVFGKQENRGAVGVGN